MHLLKKIIFPFCLIFLLGFSCKKEPSQENQVQDKPVEETKVSEPAQSPELIPSWIFEMAIITNAEKNTVITYADSDHKRIEEYLGIGDKKKLKAITIFTKDAVFKLTPENKTAIKGPPDRNQLADNRPPYALLNWAIIANEWTSSGAELLGRKTEKWNGRDYMVYRIFTPEKNSIDYYLDEEYIIKRVVNYDRNGKLLSDSTLNLKIVPLPEGIFNIPYGYIIKEEKQTKEILKR